MKVVQIIGGLGNQMFQYTLFRNLYSKDIETYYEPFITKQYHNGFELDKVFNIIERPILSLSDVDKLERFQENTWPNFNPDIFIKENVYLCGNWQNIGYFGDQDLLRQDFTFKQSLDNKNQNIFDEIIKTNSVSIHIRRGDYTNINHINYFFQANWMNYYGLAVSAIMKKTSLIPTFYIFSDDIEWAKKNTFTTNSVFVENKKTEAWKDMLLMSNCKHNITANSTFSWWAAWLNKNPNKVVVTPNKWCMDGTDSNLITLNEWIKI